VEGWGKFAVRGGILDIFPSTSDRPVRIELLGDRVESLREFNVVSQRSSDTVASVEIFPAADSVAGEGVHGGTGGASSPRATVLAVNPDLIEARIIEFATDAGLEQPPGPMLPGWGDGVSIDTIGGPTGSGVQFPGAAAREFRGNLSSVVDHWKKLSAEGTEVLLLLDGKGQVERAL
jgi:hypothetical protein